LLQATSGPSGESTRLLLSGSDDAILNEELMRVAIKKDVNALLGEDGLDRLMAQVGASQENVFNVVNSLLPQMTSVVDDMLAGKISGDVTQQVTQRAGENVISNLGRGDSAAAQGLVARDLGLTSMQIQQQGMAAAQALPAFAGAPIQSAKDVSDVINNYRTPIADRNALLDKSMDRMMASGVVGPNNLLNSSTSLLAANNNITAGVLSGNQALQMARATTGLQVNAELMGMDMALQGAQLGADAAAAAGKYYEQAAGYGALGNIAGDIDLGLLVKSLPAIYGKIKDGVSWVGNQVSDLFGWGETATQFDFYDPSANTIGTEFSFDSDVYSGYDNGSDYSYSPRDTGGLSASDLNYGQGTTFEGGVPDSNTGNDLGSVDL
jgi:hypothetical protein